MISSSDGRVMRAFGSGAVDLDLIPSRVKSMTLKMVTDQMAEWYRASASESVDLGFDSESGQTNDFKIGIHSFLV